MSNQLKLLIVFIAFSLSANLAQAGGGWVKPQGYGYYKLGQSWVSSFGYFDRDSEFNANLNSTLLTTSFYTEHGIGEGVSLEAFIPLYTRHSVEGTLLGDGPQENFSDAVGGFGDVNLGVRFELFKKDYLAMSGTVTLGLPFGGNSLGELGNLFTGDQEFNQLIRTDLSAPFGNKKFGGYSTVYVGINNRSRNFSSELHYGAELGFSAMESRVWLIGRVFAIDPFANSDGAALSNGATSNAKFSNYMVESTFNFNEKMGFSVAYTGAISGNALLVAPVYTVGLFMDIK